MSDLQDLIAMCKTQAQALLAQDRVHQYDRDEAERLDHVARWLDGREQLPGVPREWPCVLCPAEPLVPCFEDRPSSHYGRGFAISGTYPFSRVKDELGPNDTPLDRCYPTVESGPGHACRSRCLACNERGPLRDDPDTAAEDGQDHAFPGWRDMPIVTRFPHADSPKVYDKAIAKWKTTYARMFPDGYLEAGGPIRTYRHPSGTRNVPEAGPWGNYDVSAGIDPNYVEHVARKQDTVPTGTKPASTVNGRPVVDVAVGDNFALF